MKVLVLYYSRSGNTEKMANAIAEGARNVANAEVEVGYHIDADELTKFDAIIVGVPTYHHEVPMDVKRLFEEAAEKGIPLKGKTGVAFGSYGWSGEAPKLVLEIMKNRFEMRVTEPPLLVKYTPDEFSLNVCRTLGKRISESLIQQA
ncbi:MAG TPA: flavodoxin domain-containing protein [Candidatus Bathyarchaeia archaeon]|nr:flavodoxin domain-containing protein [Candidatus Bathyarchaeia archaeon]